MPISSAMPSGIKSIQRGVISISALTATATITAVDMAKTELRLLGTNGPNDVSQILATLVLTNSTTITATRTANIGNAMQVSWELTERW